VSVSPSVKVSLPFTCPRAGGCGLGLMHSSSLFSPVVGLVVSGTVHAANSDWWGLLDELSIAVPTQLLVH
jgi:hypothetical protein